VRVVEDRPAVAGRAEGGRDVRLPDALRQPRAARPPPEGFGDDVRHPVQLGNSISLGQGRQDRLEEPAAQDLHLAATDELPEPADERRALRLEPLEQRPGVMQAEMDARVALDGGDHRLVRPLEDVREDPAEVADRLMVVEDHRQRDPASRPRGHPAPTSTSAAAWGSASREPGRLIPAAGR
jgi:hypothetical protein